MNATWIDVEAGSDFPLANLPFGVFSVDRGENRIGVAIGDRIVDCRSAHEDGLFAGVAGANTLSAPVLNSLLEAGRGAWTAVRRRLTELLDAHTATEMRERVERVLVAQRDATMHLPIVVGDYVDFYSSIEHATNLGRILRPTGDPLLPNYRYLPVAYHGRSSTVVVSGTPVARPTGQRLAPGDTVPTAGPTRALDYELEVGFITGTGNALGTTIPTSRAREHIFGVVLLNDWSARDIQGWEYQPLGPFLGKSFATSISPWVVTLDALEPFRVANRAQDPQPLAYLRVEEPWAFDITLDVDLIADRHEPERISSTPFRDMYWNMAQQLAHVTINGTAIRPGDLYGSGTISGDRPETYGSLIERTWRGTRPLILRGGGERSYLLDGDTVVMRAHAERDGVRIGFGEVRGTIAG